MKARQLVIVSPALADANNGNWQTARRWRQLLAGVHRSRIVARWPDADAAGDTLMVALHARRSAASIEAWARAHAATPDGHQGLIVVLTGTDLYRDIHTDAAARRSLALARRLVVLQPQGVDELPPALRGKTQVIFQSSPARAPAIRTTRHLRAVVVGHLREEKSPQTVMEAARLLRGRHDIRIDHIGGALDPALGALAQSTATDCPAYRWLGALPHEAVRRRIQRAHVLVNTSRMEGGAQVIVEAVTSGTPVLASRVPGHVGMLGDGYAGYFSHGDAAALAGLLLQCRAAQAATASDPTPHLLARLRGQCDARAALFAPQAERGALLQLINDILESP